VVFVQWYRKLKLYAEFYEIFRFLFKKKRKMAVVVSKKLLPGRPLVQSSKRKKRR